MLSSDLNDTLKKYDLYSSQWTVLFCIHSNGAMSMAEMCKYLNVEAPTITRTVSRLEQLGWITVSQGQDRREKIVNLSQKATDQLPEIEQSVIAFEKKRLANMSAADQKKLLALLQKLGK